MARTATFGAEGIYWTVEWEPGSWEAFKITGRKQAGVRVNNAGNTGWTFHLVVGVSLSNIIGFLDNDGDDYGGVNVVPTTYGTLAEEVYNVGTYRMRFGDAGIPSGAQTLGVYVSAWDGAPGAIGWNLPSTTWKQSTTWYPSCTVKVCKRVGSTSGITLGKDDDIKVEANGQTQTALQVAGYTTSTVPKFEHYQYDSCTSAQITGDTTLYIIYVPNKSTITYYANDPTGVSQNIPAAETIDYGGTIRPKGTDPTPTLRYTVTLNPNGGTVDGSGNDIIYYSNRPFSKWNTKEDGSGTNYSAGSPYYGDVDVNLYARWGTAESIDLPKAEKDGYQFMGWGLSSTATTTVSSTYVPTGTTTLWAIFGVGNAVNIYADSSFKKYSVLIYTGSGGTNGWHRATPMVYCTANGTTGWHSCG